MTDGPDDSSDSGDGIGEREIGMFLLLFVVGVMMDWTNGGLFD